MTNRTQEQNETMLLTVLRQAGDTGLSIEDARAAISDEAEQSKSLTKKMLEHLRTKGCVKIKMGKSGLCYVIVPGR